MDWMRKSNDWIKPWIYGSDNYSARPSDADKLMKTFSFVLIFLLAACASNAPSGFERYCRAHPSAPACGGAK